jgi:hypothetical protein
MGGGGGGWVGSGRQRGTIQMGTLRCSVATKEICFKVWYKMYQIICMIVIRKCNKKFDHRKDKKYHNLMRRMGWRLLLELEILH